MLVMRGAYILGGLIFWGDYIWEAYIPDFTVSKECPNKKNSNHLHFASVIRYRKIHSGFFNIFFGKPIMLCKDASSLISIIT